MNTSTILSNSTNRKNDIIYTKPEFAKKVIDYLSPQFKSTDIFLDPCRGQSAFYHALPNPKDWCEIEEGKDFLLYTKNVNWIISNFPWSAKALRPIHRHACDISDNVVQLIRLHNFFGTPDRQYDYLNQNHFLKEIIFVDWKDAINKKPEGFSLIVVHSQRNYNDNCKFTYWTKSSRNSTYKNLFDI